MNAIPCYGGLQNWKDDLHQYVRLYETKALPLACAVVVNRTLQTAEFQSFPNRIPGDSLMFVGDECHHHRSRKLNGSLPLQAAYRLGLSATPAPYFNSREPDLLTEYYGPVSYRYDLKQALSDGLLSPYNYFLEIVDLTPQEAEEYEKLSAEITRLSIYADTEDSDAEDDTRLKNLLFRRSRLIGAAAKIKGSR